MFFVLKFWFVVIDWYIIIILSGLMLLIKGVELSGYFDVLGCKMVCCFVMECWLVMFMVLVVVLFFIFLINDVVLFIVVLLIIMLKRLCEILVNWLIIFEVLVVNVGSLLTLIGNL